MLSRAKIEGREDDNEEVIQKRCQEYNNKTLPVANYYSEKGLCYHIEGDREMDEVFEEITKIVERVK
jgi:adenylate kinase